MKTLDTWLEEFECRSAEDNYLEGFYIPENTDTLLCNIDCPDSDCGERMYVLDPEKVKDFLSTMYREVREETENFTRLNTLDVIINQFERMVFDNTGEDKMLNIMNFRQKQLDWLKNFYKVENKQV